MTYLRSFRQNLFPISDFFSLAQGNAKLAASVVTVAILATTCLAQESAPPAKSQETTVGQGPNENATVTVPAGTRIALVLTHPVQSRYMRRGDDIYAQVISPVNIGSEVVIPPGTFVQGTFDKLGRKGDRGELRLQSMSITFPDGYVAPLSGPVTLESNEGYALKDPGHGRGVGAVVLPLAGVSLGALIGHSVGTSQATLTSALPPGCTGPPPFCLSSSLPIPGSKGKDTAIGASIGGAAGMIASITLLVSSHHFFLDVGAPVEMTLQQPVSLQTNEVADALRQSELRPAPPYHVAPRPVAPPPSDMPVDHGTCYTPDTPGTPPTVIPGAPGPDGIPGPPTVIPGTPPIPGTPYPCP